MDWENSAVRVGRWVFVLLGAAVALVLPLYGFLMATFRRPRPTSNIRDRACRRNFVASRHGILRRELGVVA